MDALAEAAAWLLILLILAGLLLIFFSLVVQLQWMVPFVPTPKPIIDGMIAFAELKPGQIVFDLGAGDGRVLLAAEKHEPKIHATGYEGALVVWMLAKFRMRLRRSKVQMKMKNFMLEDLSKADVIFTYLSIEMMRKLKPKFLKELKPGAKVISHAFRLPDIKPAKEQLIRMRVWGGSRIYCYVWPEKTA